MSDNPSQFGLKSCIATIAATICLVAIALIVLLAYSTSFYGWKIYLELFSHFQVQYFIVSLILLVVLILTRRKWFFLAGLLLCAMLSLPILTWYVWPPRFWLPPSTSRDLRVLVANINTQNQSYDKVIDLVRSQAPDIAILMEANDTWQRKLRVLSDILPYSSGRTNDYNLGILVYGKDPLEETQIEFFGGESASIIASLTVGDRPVTLLATHPLPPVKPRWFHSRNQQFDRIIQYLDSVETPIILAGDLNVTMWSPYYRRLANRTGLLNTRDGFGILPTWPTPATYGMFRAMPDWLAFLMQIPIDHCLASPEFETVAIQTGPKTGSDHLPLIVDLRLGDRG